MALYHKWDIKNDFAYVLQFFSLISDSLGSVTPEHNGGEYLSIRFHEIFFNFDTVRCVR